MTAQGPAHGVPIDALLAHRDWVRALARRLVSDPNAADDVEQETWRMALERPPLHAASLRQWLSAVVRNAARGAGRSRASRAKYEANAPVRPDARAPGDVVAAAEIQHRLVGEVLALEEPYRSAILQRFFESRDATEIAAATGVPVETVRTRIKRGLAMLRARMDVTLGDDDGAWCLLVLGWRPEGIPAPFAGTGAGAGTSSGTASGTAALTGAAGGMAMGLGAKLGIGAAVVVLALMAWRPWAEPVLPEGGGVSAAAPPAATSHTSSRSGNRARPGDDAAPSDASTAAAATPASPEARLAAADRDLDLHGIVVRKDGTPVAGATLQAISYPWRRAPTLNWEGMTEESPGPSATSGEDGTFALRLRRGENVVLRVTKTGFARLELADVQAGERVRAVMEPGVRLIVTAKNPAGAPLDAVRLRLSTMLTLQPRMVTIDARAETTADGTCTFDDLPGGIDVMLIPMSRVGGPLAQFRIAESGEMRHDLVLGEGRKIHGCVTDAATGAPVARARVGMGWPLIGAVETSADGTYALEGWNGRSFSDVHVAAAGYVRANEKPGDLPSLDFALEPGARVRGRIVAADGAPVASACVSCIASTFDDAVQRVSMADARSGADGVFHLSGLRAGPAHALTVVATGAGRVQRSVTIPPLVAGEHDLGDIVVPAPRAIEGRLLDPSGAPAARMGVTLTGPLAANSPPDGSTYGGREARRSDDLGRFRFPDLAPGRYRVEMSTTAGATTSLDVEIPADRDLLDVVLPPQSATPGAVAVTVVDATGAPVEGIPIVGVLDVSGVRQPTARSDAHGRALLEAPSRGRIREVVAGMPLPPDVLNPKPAPVARGVAECRVVVERGAQVTYLILDPEGKPVSNAIASVTPAGASTRGMTRADGRGDLVVPRTGTFTIAFDGAVYTGEKYVAKDSGLEARVDGVTAASGEVVLRAHRVETGRRVTLRLLEEDGTPAAGVDVTLVAAGLRAASARTDADGRATFEGLAARTTTVWVAPRPGDLYPRSEPFVPEGQEVVVRFPAAVQISGIALWSTGEPGAAYINVYALREAGDVIVFSMRADENGRFAVKVPAGDPGPFEIEAALMRADRTPTGIRRPLAPSDRDVQLVIPR